MKFQIFSFLQIFTILSLLKFTNGNNQYSLLTSYCSEEQNYVSETDYLDSLQHLLSTLTSKSKTQIFYSYTSITNSDVIYGLFYCTHRFRDPICHECIKAASVQISQSCPSSSEAIVWHSDCMLRYSNRDILSINDVSKSYSIVVGDKKYSKFSKELSNTFNRLIGMATSIKSTSVFDISAEMSIPFSRYVDVRCYADCTPDIEPSECSRCLKAGLGRLGFDGSESGMVLLPSCRLKYVFTEDPDAYFKGMGKYAARFVILVIVGVASVAYMMHND